MATNCKQQESGLYQNCPTVVFMSQYRVIEPKLGFAFGFDLFLYPN